MGAGKKIVAGAVLAGGGVLLRTVGNGIIAAFGASQGPYLDYAFLVNGTSWLLVALGGIVAGIGVLSGLYRLVSGGGEEPRPEQPPQRRGRRTGEQVEGRGNGRQPRQGRRRENDRR